MTEIVGSWNGNDINIRTDVSAELMKMTMHYMAEALEIIDSKGNNTLVAAYTEETQYKINASDRVGWGLNS